MSLNGEYVTYKKSCLKELNEKDNFTDSAIEHIFEGSVNRKGEYRELYHYDAENRLQKTCGDTGVGVDFLLGKNGFKLGYSLGYGNGISIIWEDVE